MTVTATLARPGPIRSTRGERSRKGANTDIYVCVPMEEGNVRGVRTFMTESSAQHAEAA